MTSMDDLLTELNKNWRFRWARLKQSPGWWLYELACRYKKWFEKDVDTAPVDWSVVDKAQETCSHGDVFLMCGECGKIFNDSGYPVTVTTAVESGTESVTVWGHGLVNSES